MAASKADEAAGLAPSNEKNEAGRYFSSEKPCLPLSINGTPFFGKFQEGAIRKSKTLQGKTKIKGKIIEIGAQTNSGGGNAL